MRQYVAGRFFLEFADGVDDRFSLLAHLGADDLVIGVVGIVIILMTARGLSVGSNGFRLGTCAGHPDDRRPEVRG